MANTLPNILLPANVWVELYAQSGITPGTQIAIENLTYNMLQVVVAASAPVGDAVGYSLIHGFDTVANESGDLKVYVRSLAASGLVNVREMAI